MENDVPWSMLNVPAPVELLTLYGGYSTPLVQLRKPRNVRFCGDSIFSYGEMPFSSAAASVKTLNVDPAAHPGSRRTSSRR